MRAWNRAKLLWGYLARRAVLGALPVDRDDSKAALASLDTALEVLAAHGGIETREMHWTELEAFAAGLGEGQDRLLCVEERPDLPRRENQRD